MKVDTQILKCVPTGLVKTPIGTQKEWKTFCIIQRLYVETLLEMETLDGQWIYIFVLCFCSFVELRILPSVAMKEEKANSDGLIKYRL